MLSQLLDGHHRFRHEHFVREQALFRQLSEGVHEPTALVLSCCDARVVPDLILSAPPGELFVVRNIANVVPPLGDPRGVSVASALEYAILALEVPHVIVCGHTECGGLKAALKGRDKLGPGLSHVANWLELTDGAREDAIARALSPEQAEELLIYANVMAQLEHLLSYPLIAERLDAESLDIHGWVYDLASGGIMAYDPDCDGFMPLSADTLEGLGG